MNKAKRERLENEFAMLWASTGGSPFVRQYAPWPAVRQYRFDFAKPDLRIAIEIDGGQWIHGSHQRAQRYESDCDKLNSAALDGWLVLRFTTNHLYNRIDEMLETVKMAIDRRLKDDY